MNTFKIACQTITWGDGQMSRFPEVLRSVAESGYDGVEIGFRRLAALPPKEMKKLLVDNKLLLAASHIGGNLEDRGQAGREKGMLGKVLDYLNEIGADTLMYSGFAYKSIEERDRVFRKDLAALNNAAGICAGRGIKLLYHNHDREFFDSWNIMSTLLAESSPTLGFCPDIGWLVKPEVKVVSFLDKLRGRIGTIHFKDFATREKKIDTVELGTGIVDHRAAAEWIKMNCRGIWITAEQDVTSTTPEMSTRRNAEYLINTFTRRIR